MSRRRATFNANRKCALSFSRQIRTAQVDYFGPMQIFQVLLDTQGKATTSCDESS